jgi:hypothetical protein
VSASPRAAASARLTGDADPEEIMKKDKPKAQPKPLVIARGKIAGQGTKANSCANCAGSKFC